MVGEAWLAEADGRRAGAGGIVRGEYVRERDATATWRKTGGERPRVSERASERGTTPASERFDPRVTKPLRQRDAGRRTFYHLE